MRRNLVEWPNNLLYAMGAYRMNKNGKKIFDKSLAITSNDQTKRLKTLLDSGTEPEVREFIYQYYRNGLTYKEISISTEYTPTKISYMVQKAVMYLKSMNGLDYVLYGNNDIFSKDLFMSGLDKKTLFVLNRHNIHSMQDLHTAMVSHKIYDCNRIGAESIVKMVNILINNGYGTEEYRDVINYYYKDREKVRYSTEVYLSK